MAVGVVFLRAGDAGRDGAGDLRLVVQRRAKAHGFRVGNGLKADFKTAITGGPGGQAGNHRTGAKGLRGTAGDFQDLAGCQRGAAADAAELSLAIEVTFVTQACVKVAAFAEQVFVMGIRIAETCVGFSVVIGLAVGGAGATGLVDVAVQVGVGDTMMVSADVDVFFHHLMAGLQGPRAVLPAAAESGLRTVRQLDIELVVTLVIVKLHHVDVQARIMGEAVPDAHIGQQSGDKSQVAFAVLHDLFAPGVVTHQIEEKVLPFEIMPGTQDAFDDLRHRLVLIDTELPASAKQGQARFQADFVAGFINRTGQAFKTRDHAIQRAQRINRGRTQPQKRQVVRRTVQAETGVLSEYFFGVDITVETGELHAVVKRLAQGFNPFERQDIKPCIEVANLEHMTAVVEEGAQLIEHGQASVATSGALFWTSLKCRKMPPSSL
ncbi:Uncharacterized protein ALO51_05476 [Pseudomonas amygdali]|nr:Uncharacterized protein ALO51_05476 [Pseudomonas amygdali]